MQPQEFVEKHVTISMSNGAVLEGFITGIEDGYLSLVELNNAKVLVRVEHISFIRSGPPEPDPEHMAMNAQQVEDFSMPLEPNQSRETYVRQAQFVRETPRQEE